MGFLKILGTTLNYNDSRKHFKSIKDNFVKYVIAHLNSLKNQKNLKPLFGYELEVHKIIIDHKKKKVYLDLSAQNDILRLSSTHLKLGYQISHEFGGWMIESTSDMPFSFKNLKNLEKNVANLYNYLQTKEFMYEKDMIIKLIVNSFLLISFFVKYL